MIGGDLERRLPSFNRAALGASKQRHLGVARRDGRGAVADRLYKCRLVARRRGREEL